MEMTQPARRRRVHSVSEGRDPRYALKHLVSGDFVVSLEPRFGRGDDALPLSLEGAERLAELLRRRGALVAIVPLGERWLRGLCTFGAADRGSEKTSRGRGSTRVPMARMAATSSWVRRSRPHGRLLFWCPKDSRAVAYVTSQLRADVRRDSFAVGGCNESVGKTFVERRGAGNLAC